MTCCTYPSRGKQSSGCLRLSLLYIFLVSHTEARPVAARTAAGRTTRAPRWRNPCQLSITEMTVRLFLGLSTEVKEELCANILDSTRVAHFHAKSVLANYEIQGRIPANTDEDSKEFFIKVDESFKDKSFIEGTASHRLDWLPKVIPSDVDTMDFHETIRYFYNVLQYFAVGLEQIIADQVVYDGKYFSEFRDVEDNMAQLLCTIQLGMASLRIEPNADVMRDVMKQQYRNVGSHSQRLIRNYLILRDYVHALDVMVKTLEVIRDRTLYATTTPELTPDDSQQSFHAR